MTCSNQMHLSPDEGAMIHAALFTQLRETLDRIVSASVSIDTTPVAPGVPADPTQLERLHDLALSYADTLSALRKVEAAFAIHGTLPWGEPITLDHDPEVTRPTVHLEEEAVTEEVAVEAPKDDFFDLPIPRRSPYKPKR